MPSSGSSDCVRIIRNKCSGVDIIIHLAPWIFIYFSVLLLPVAPILKLTTFHISREGLHTACRQYHNTRFFCNFAFATGGRALTILEIRHIKTHAHASDGDRD